MLNSKERELFDHIQVVDSAVRSDGSLQGIPLRFGRDHLGISDLNELSYCEYKFEIQYGEGMPIPEEVIAALPESSVRKGELQHLKQSHAAEEAGDAAHGDIALSLAGKGKRSEVRVSAPFCGVLLLGCMDFPSLENGSVHIVDWKTGRVPKPGDAWAGDVLQVLGYCYVMRYILDQSPVFRSIPITGSLCYTQRNQWHSIPYDSTESVVRAGFTQYRVWSEYTPSGLIEDKLSRLWMYFVGEQDAVPSGFDGKHAGCEYRSVCKYSPYRVI